MENRQNNIANNAAQNNQIENQILEQLTKINGNMITLNQNIVNTNSDVISIKQDIKEMNNRNKRIERKIDMLLKKEGIEVPVNDLKEEPKIEVLTNDLKIEPKIEVLENDLKEEPKMEKINKKKTPIKDSININLQVNKIDDNNISRYQDIQKNSDIFNQKAENIIKSLNESQNDSLYTNSFNSYGNNGQNNLN